MKLESAIKTAKELRDFGDETAVALAALDRLAEYDANFDAKGFVEAQRKLTDKSRVLIGLVFSEFLADPERANDESELIRAATKQEMLLNQLGLDRVDLLEERNRLIGLN